MVQDNLLTAFRSISKFKSLSFQLLLGMIIWLIFALIFTGYTLLLSWELEEEGVSSFHLFIHSSLGRVLGSMVAFLDALSG